MINTTCKNFFYQKVETLADMEYPEGSSHYYLHYFITELEVMGPDDQMVHAPAGSFGSLTGFLSFSKMWMRF
ncbi:MAG: hypothetical protein ACI4CT_08535 [Lachnospiraceae bacterium]